MYTRTLLSQSPEETHRLGIKLGKNLDAGDVVALTGELGSGKTCLIQGITVGLDILNPRQVTSPTFTLINEYQGRVPIYHFDLYRINKLEELFDLGFEEYFYGKGVTLVEWAEKILDWLPPQRLSVYLKILSEGQREIQLSTSQTKFERLFQSL
ncbi:MAG TPA: tRNA (adenosine(37)-N6)-threonylcarbamoyltransferase complex ATPase subunit type 1 TsaE [Candidatus Limnocylindrales bacterium]|nr:tRNA (adenosine(37)-N6)-threonylcarbamoyltransferase complex ATPase subunit type 1 TsaE [Candidatus Limnocylindrales bacterium]